MKSFAKRVLENGGTLKPLVIDSSLTNGTGLFNPSLFVDEDQIHINVRHCQYTLYHSELNKHEHPWGPLLYFNPENDITLTTTNYFGRLDDNLNLVWTNKVDTSKLDVKPIWEFVGLEDARLVKWNDKTYMCGVRRDTTTNGQGRMELSEVEIVNNTVKEVSRTRIPAPGANDSYCEKNWMPILDKPFHFLKWCNPVEFVKFDPVTNKCETVYLGTERYFNWDLRGGGQVIPFEDGYLSLTHETDLYTSEAGRKDATYRHRLVHWSKDWIPIRKSEKFSFMDAKIEFACGLAEYKGNILITFGFQDNAAFILSCPKNVVKDYMNA
jgi:predicted GH43/DUF377 family glycosyl hydrolase